MINGQLSRTNESWQSNANTNIKSFKIVNTPEGRKMVTNGTETIETQHIPTSQEIIEICTLETKNKRFYS
jgi:hypothetical protein